MVRASVVLASALAAVFFAVPAIASDVYLYQGAIGTPISGGVLNAHPGETNDVTVTYDAAQDAYVITDTAGIRIFDQPPIRDQNCTRRTATTVVCRWTFFLAWLGDGNDRLDASNAARPDTVQVERSRNGDTYTIASQRGVLATGGLGADVLVGSAGADRLDGGASSDDGDPDDTSTNTVIGGAGPDSLIGRGGDDRVDDVDYFDYGEVDSISLTNGNDQIQGGPGNDEIYPLRGSDTVDAGEGDDVVYSNDGSRSSPASRVSCGGGNDKVDPGRGDTLTGCERLWVTARCGLCTVTLEADLGAGKRAPIAQARVGRRVQTYLLLALNTKGRALLQQRGTLRVRFTVRAADGKTAGQDWFVLKR